MRYVCGLDIGSSKVAACLAGFRHRQLENLWWNSAPAVGVKRGQWQDISGLTVALSRVLKKLKQKSGVKIKSVHLGIAGENITARHSQAVIALAERGNRSVSQRDIQNVNQQAQILGSCLEDEILHSLPLRYAVDNENEVIDPLNLYGHQLKVDLYLICAKASYINTIIGAINRLGLRLNEITLSGLAVSQAVFNRARMKGLDILCDIGKDIIQILIFNQGRLMHYQIVTAGGDDLTTALSRELSLAYPLAEEVKIAYGRVQNTPESPDKEIILKKGYAYSTLSQNSVIQILSRESRRLAEIIRNVIQPHLLAMSPPLAAVKPTLYVSGRNACLDGFLELLEVTVGIPVKMAKIGNSGLSVPLMRRGLLSGEPVLNYLACLGLLVKAGQLPHKKSTHPMRGLRSLLSSLPEKVREMYQEYF
jgi:cell division protein FtsA